jgi:WD40 repeat protein
LMGLWPYSRDEAGSQRNFEIAVSASGQYVAASGHRTTHLYVRGIESGREYPALGASIAFSPDEKLLASGYSILNLETGNIIKLEVSSDLECSDYEHKTPAFSPDGQIMAAMACDYLVFWRVSDGAFLAKLDNPYKIFQVKFSPDGTFLVGRGEGVINQWGLPALTP